MTKNRKKKRKLKKKAITVAAITTTKKKPQMRTIKASRHYRNEGKKTSYLGIINKVKNDEKLGKRKRKRKEKAKKKRRIKNKNKKWKWKKKNSLKKGRIDWDKTVVFIKLDLPLFAALPLHHVYGMEHSFACKSCLLIFWDA